MTNHPFHSLPERGAKLVSARNLDAWVNQAQERTGLGVGRVGWIVASSVVVAVLQRALHHDNQPRFALKGGAYLEHRLSLRTRATQDVDALFRGDFNQLLDALDECLSQTWGPIEFSRTEPEVIDGVPRAVKPRRFEIQLKIRGKVWRKVKVEVAPDEGSAGSFVEMLPAVPLDHFALPSAHQVAGIVVDYQVAQKIHACTDPHDPPTSRNDRPRDVVDLLLLRDELYPPETNLSALRTACIDIFAARAAEAPAAGVAVRDWPPTVVTYPHWTDDFKREAGTAGFSRPLEDAVVDLNAWIAEIAATSGR